MDNQQPSTLVDRIRLLARNAKVGDGQIWTHPTCVNSKIIYTSTEPELLELKRRIAPEIFSTGVKFFDTSGHKGRYANAKPMYRLASVTHPIISIYKKLDKLDVVNEMSITDFALWFMDDGSSVERKDSGGYRYYLSIGNICSTPDKEEFFHRILSNKFGPNHGSVHKNNSKATENNKSWIIPVKIAELILHQFSCLVNELYGEGSETIRKE